jgi:hypothetical protein
MSSLRKYNIIQAKFDSLETSNQRLIPFSLTIGPFSGTFDLSKFDLEIQQLASIDNNDIVSKFKVSGQTAANFKEGNKVLRWVKKDDENCYYIIMLFRFDLLTNNNQAVQLGHDFKFKVKAHTRECQFWLNSEAIRN